MLRSQIALDETTGTRAMTIAEMSTRYNVSLRTLRFYEDRGLISPTRIGTQRFYSDKDEIRLQIVLKGKRLGFTLSEIEFQILSQIDANAEATRLAPDVATTEVLTPELVQRKIDKLRQARATTEEAIAELTSRIEQLPMPVG